MKTINTCLIITIAFILVSCNVDFNKGDKLISESKYKEAIEVLSKINSEDSKYDDAKEKINYAHYMIAIKFIKDNQIDSANNELAKIKKGDKIYKQVKSAMYYCDALNSIGYKNQKEALDFLNKVDKESEFYENAKIKINEITIANSKKEMSFSDFAKEFTLNAGLSFDNFKMYCGSVIHTNDCDLGGNTAQSFENAYKDIKQIIKTKKYRIVKYSIEFYIDKFYEYGCGVEFYKTGNTWKIKEYWCPC